MSPKTNNWFRRYSEDEAHFYSLYSVVTLKSRSKSPKSTIFLIIPMIQYIKFGQNPSFCSRGRLHYFGQNLTFKVLV